MNLHILENDMYLKKAKKNKSIRENGEHGENVPQYKKKITRCQVKVIL